jgi:hypothetical protein
MNFLATRELAEIFFGDMLLVKYELSYSMPETILHLTYVNVIIGVCLYFERKFALYFQTFLEFRKVSDKIYGCLA